MLAWERLTSTVNMESGKNLLYLMMMMMMMMNSVRTLAGQYELQPVC